MKEPKVTVKIRKDLHRAMKLAAVHGLVTVQSWLEEAIRDKLKSPIVFPIELQHEPAKESFESRTRRLIKSLSKAESEIVDD
jgi:hypothetical protein